MSKLNAIAALGVLGLFIFLPQAASAADYDPVPPGWSVRIEMPGLLKVGARYCAQGGRCETVGADIAGFTTKNGTPISAPQACQMNPRLQACREGALPVQVLAASPNNSVIVRSNGRNYAVSGNDVIVQTATGERQAFEYAIRAPAPVAAPSVQPGPKTKALSQCLERETASGANYSANDGGNSAIRLYAPCRQPWDDYVEACKATGRSEGQCNLLAGTLAQASLKLRGR